MIHILVWLGLCYRLVTLFLMRGILAARRRACETSESSGSSSSEESDSQPEASSPDSSTDSGASDSSSNDSEQERQRVVALKRRDQTAKARAALATKRFQEMKQRCEPRLQRLAGCQSFNRRYSPQSSMLKTGGECAQSPLAWNLQLLPSFCKVCICILSKKATARLECSCD